MKIRKLTIKNLHSLRLDAEIVRDNPDMFTYDVDAEAGDSVRVTAVAVGPDAPVEEATAVPGQKRSARRPRA